MHTPRRTKDAGTHVGLAKLRETLDRAGRAARKDQERHPGWGGSGLKVWGSHHCPCHPAQAEQTATEGKEGRLENAYGMFNTVITLEETTITAKLIWHLLYTRPCAKGETSEEGLDHLPRDTQPPGRDLHADARPPWVSAR